MLDGRAVRVDDLAANPIDDLRRERFVRGSCCRGKLDRYVVSDVGLLFEDVRRRNIDVCSGRRQRRGRPDGITAEIECAAQQKKGNAERPPTPSRATPFQQSSP